MTNHKDFGRYHILEQIGSGGMADVFKAFDTRLERDVALKVIRTELFPPIVLDRILKRFEREAKIMAQLSHPNIVKVYDYGEQDGTPYFVMEYLPWGTLKQFSESPMPYTEAAQLLAPIARALAFAHAENVLHRDIKPANILISRSRDVVLTDFGIAKLLEETQEKTLTGTGIGVGTPEYMAPEQGLGKVVDGRADQYSLGIVFYELVTGRKPYQADTPMAVLLKQMNDPVPPPGAYVPELPEPVERVLFKALAKNPDDRYQDMNAFAVALEKIAEGAEPEELITAKAEQTHSQARSFSQIPAVQKHETEVETQDELLPSYDFPTSPTGVNMSAGKKRVPAWLLLVPLLLMLGVGGLLLRKGTEVTPVPTPESKLIPVQATQQAFATLQHNAELEATRRGMTQQAAEETAIVETFYAQTATVLEGTIAAFSQTQTAQFWTPTFTPSPTSTFTPSPTMTITNSPTIDPRSMEYDRAILLMAAEKWEAAAAVFTGLGNYQDAPVKAAEATVNDFLEKREYAKMTEFVRSIADQTLQSTLKEQIYQALYAGEQQLFAIRGCNGKVGFVDLFNEQVIEPRFDYAWDFSEGLALIKRGWKYGYVNTAGEVVVEPRFDFGDSFSGRLAPVKQDGEWGYINTAGEMVIGLHFFYFAWPFSEGLALVKQDWKLGYINTDGKIVIEPRFESAGSFSEGLAQIRQDGKWGYINTAGKIVIEPRFDLVGDFSEGLALVWQGGKNRYINTAGEMVIEPRFDYAYDFSEGLARVEQSGKYGYINTAGEVVVEPRFEMAGDFSNGLAQVRQNGKYGYINIAGEVVIEPRFDEAKSFSNGLAWVEQDGKEFYIDPTGAVVLTGCKQE